ncbi:hypothetical protein Gasu2_49460 [Galdieria sulphuraria]|uniref:Aminopeptidase isoform 1 n=1 Tax=Galdieria sulphuraria TaxID=130081 RepID=M2W4M8_GALSU|nr:aminopeptidase isoform 1 [Galdieria sulphuraria]EME30701.1 aminopeptidase isoform 1 [Galdieria sulphuraria]GJD10776.1 hypothetical protein Gasu2_49460 [Galdieria sulphuraria]|eukprot:XP_005707221.1 aminopeptidase isoform 1 [Galdieria sulphuraria]
MFVRKTIQRVATVCDGTRTSLRNPFLVYYSRYSCTRRTLRVAASSSVLLFGFLVITFFWKCVKLERHTVTNKDWLFANFWPQPDVESLEQLESFAKLFLDQDIKTLSSDKMEGRGVGTQGERKSARFIAGAFEDALLEGAFSDPSKNTQNSFYQQVPLEGVQVENASFVSYLKDLKNNSVSLIQGESCSLTTDLSDSNIVDLTGSKLMFGGYCIYAPKAPFFWDDFGNVSVKNRIILCLVNQPSYFFNIEDRLTYYGRWSYKLEELRRRGALGVLLLHTAESAGYGWNVIRSNSQSESIRLRYLEKNASPLLVYGWLSSVAWDNLAEKGIIPYTEDLKNYAETKGFLCNEDLFDLSFYAQFQVKRRTLNGLNVGALVQSSTKEFLDASTDSLIVVTSHYDHLGKINNDCHSSSNCIYHGALDNASGVAKLLVLARTFGFLKHIGKCCKRSILFLSPTAEEAVLLGSSYYVDHPILPLNQTVACINFDGMNVWGRTRDAVALGYSLSDLGDLFREVTTLENLTVGDDPEPHLGHLYRSDQFPFLQRGVPSLKLTHGKIFQGHENEDYFNRVVGEYLKNRYHQVLDNYEYIHEQSDPYTGALQELRIAFRLLFALAQSEVTPHWKFHSL